MDHFKLFMLSLGFIITTMIHHITLFTYRICRRTNTLALEWRRQLNIQCSGIIRKRTKEDVC